MGNSLASCRHRRRCHSRRRWSVARYSRSESANFDFRASDVLLRATSHAEEEVGLDPTTIPAWLQETLGSDRGVEAWLRLTESLNLGSGLKSMESLVVGSLTDERLRNNLHDLAEWCRQRLPEEEQQQRQEEASPPQRKRRVLLLISGPLLLTLLLSLLLLI